MPPARLRLVWLFLTAGLFAAWIGWLGFSVWNRPLVLAHDPFLVADVDVLASIKDLNERVTVREVAWARDPKLAEGLEGKDVRVTNLERCRQDWRGPGEYLLPLLKTGADTYEVADPTGVSEEAKREPARTGGVPSRSPGYDPYLDHDGRTLRPPHIYPATPETRAQLREILGSK